LGRRGAAAFESGRDDGDNGRNAKGGELVGVG
jgi:hypothetical protein